MRVAFMASGDPLDVHTWSGTPYYMVRALQTLFPDLIVVRKQFPLLFSEFRHRLRWITDGGIDALWLPRPAPLAALPYIRYLRKQRAEVVVCVANTTIGCAVSSCFPTIHVSDATFSLMRSYYDFFAKLQPWVQRSGNRMEARIITQSRACLYSSRWAAESAIKDYGADAAKVHFIPWGCNIDPVASPPNWPARHEAGAPCDIVFIGTDWTRKGGDIAVATVRQLRNAGIPAHLHVVGATLPGVESDDAVTWHGFISKSKPEGRARFETLMRGAAFKLLPTRQDCTPMVVAEANAYGIPVIATDTGGVGSLIANGKNGCLLPEAAGPLEYASLIASIWADRGRYLDMRVSARYHHDTVSNWAIWAARVGHIAEQIQAPDPHGSLKPFG